MILGATKKKPAPEDIIDFGDEEQSFEEMKKKQDEELDFTGKIQERKEREKKERKERKKKAGKPNTSKSLDMFCTSDGHHY